MDDHESSQAWVRIPEPILSETDRRELAAILTSAGLEVRIVRAKLKPNGNTQKFIEFRKKTQGKEG